MWWKLDDLSFGLIDVSLYYYYYDYLFFKLESKDNLLHSKVDTERSLI